MEIDQLRCGRFFQSDLAEAQFKPEIQTALLGKEPRYAPDRAFDTLHVELDLNVDFRRLEIDAACATRIRAFRDRVGSLEFDACDMRIRSVQIDGKSASFRHDGKTLRIALKRPLSAKQEAEVLIRYRLKDPKVGLHFVLEGRSRRAGICARHRRQGCTALSCRRRAVQLWSQGQPEDSKYWFPCHDAPHEKATSGISVTVPREFETVSNGVLIEKNSGRRAGTSTFRWRMDHPHSLYLITLAAGRFGVVKDEWRGVPLFFYCEKGREADVRRGLGKTAKAMEFFSNKIGVPYPYEQYAQVVVSEYPGGMENTTATTMTDACLIDRRAAADHDVDSLMAHELAHQWFGDLLTCRDWSHAWLNEGFATYFEALFTLHDKGQDEFDYELHNNKKYYFYEDEKKYRRPIVCRTFRNPWVLFDRHLYEKGAWVLHMLRRKLGDELFWKSIERYVREFRYQSVETTDLIQAIERETGRNLKPFFDQWVYRAGYPSIKATYHWDQKAKKAVVSVSQTQSGDDSPGFQLDLDFRMAGRGWLRSFTKQFSKKEDEWEFRLPSEPLTVEIDPDHWLLKKLSFRKPNSMWIHQLRSAPRAISRIAAAHEVARWGDSNSVSALTDAIRRETFWGAAAEFASALGSIRTPAAYDALRSLMRHRHPKVRRAAVEALGEFKSANAADELLLLLRKDPSVLVESSAIRALANLRLPKHSKVVKQKTKTASYRDSVQAAAAYGLAAMRQSSGLGTLRRMSDVSFPPGARMAAIRCLGEFHSMTGRVIDWISEHLEDRDQRVVLAAVQALGRTEDGAAIRPLEKLKKESRDSRVQAAIDEALATINRPASRFKR